jgi:hypothetical protein
MTPNEETDPIVRMLARLPSLSPTAASADRVRARCHAQLAGRQRNPARAQRGRISTRVLNAAAFAAITVYLTEALRLALSLGR